jgi:hypothetical protein
MVDMREFLDWKRENWPKAKSAEEDERQLGAALKAYTAKLRRDEEIGTNPTHVQISEHKPFKIQSTHDHRRSRKSRDGNCQEVATKVWATRSSALQTRYGHSNLNAPSTQQHYITASRDVPTNGGGNQATDKVADEAQNKLNKRMQVMLQLKKSAGGQEKNKKSLMNYKGKTQVGNQALSADANSGDKSSRRPSSASMFANSFKQAMGKATKVAHKAGDVASKLLHKKAGGDLYDHSDHYQDWQYMKDATYRRPDLSHNTPGLHNNGPEGGYHRQTRPTPQAKTSKDAWQMGPPTMFRYTWHSTDIYICPAPPLPPLPPLPLLTPHHHHPSPSPPLHHHPSPPLFYCRRYGEEYLGESDLMKFRTVDAKALGMVDENHMPKILGGVHRGHAVKKCVDLVHRRVDRETGREFELTRLQSFVDGKSTASHFYKWLQKRVGGECVMSLMPYLLQVMPSEDAQKALLSANDLLGDNSERDAQWKSALHKNEQGAGVKSKFGAHRPRHVGADGNRISFVDQVPVDTTKMTRLIPAVQIREGGPGVARGAGGASGYKAPTRMRMSKQFQSRELFKKLHIAGEQSRTGAAIYGGSEGTLFSGAIANLRATNQMLTSLKLHNQRLNQEHMLILGAAVANGGRGTLTELDLSHNPLMNKGAIALGSMLPRSPKLERLTLIECGIGCAGAVKLLTGHMGVVSHLTHLNLTGNRVNGTEPSLTAFPVDPCDGDDDSGLLGRNYADGMKVVARAIHEQPNLRVLSLAANGIAAVDVAMLCAGLVQSEATGMLESIDLNANPFGDGGAVSIARALRSTTSRLGTLSLGQSGMGVLGVKALLTSARYNSALKTIVVTLPGVGIVGSTAEGGGGIRKHSRTKDAKILTELTNVLQANRHRMKTHTICKSTTRREIVMTSSDPYDMSQVRRLELGKHVPKVSRAPPLLIPLSTPHPPLHSPLHHQHTYHQHTYHLTPNSHPLYPHMCPRRSTTWWRTRCWGTR